MLVSLLYYGLPCYASGTILILGDSLSAGYGLNANESWVSLLEKKLKDKDLNYTVVNGSTSGATTADGLAVLPNLLKTYQPVIVVVALGSNDGLRGSPIYIIQRNLSAIIDLANKSKARVLLIGFQLPSNYGKSYTSQFANVYPELSKKFKLPLVPFMLEGFATDLKFFQEDKLHPTAAAHHKILNNIWPYLRKMLAS